MARRLAWIPALLLGTHLISGCAASAAAPVPQAPREPAPVVLRAIHIEALARAMWNEDSGEGDRRGAGALHDEAARRYAEEGGQEAARARCLHASAWCLQPNSGQGTKEEWETARSRFEEAARLRGDLGDVRGRAVSLYKAAHCLRPDKNRAGGDWARAAAGFEESARLWGESGREAYRGAGLHWLAWCLQHQEGDGSEARWARVTGLFAEAARLRGEGSDREGRATSLRALGHALSPTVNPRGDWEESAKAFERAAEDCEALGDGEGCDECLKEAAVRRSQIR